MENLSYQRVKEFIYGQLVKNDGVMLVNTIRNLINNTKSIISTIGTDNFASLINVPQLTILTDDQWEQMNREFETLFDVRMENGILIQGEDQQNRDQTWWTNKVKQEKEGYYWKRYKDYLKSSMPPEVVKTIDEDTDVMMDNLENPASQHFNRYGMVVGHVQSGKTGNYAALVCKAADADYKFIVIIAGTINNLRNQTQERINEAFIGMDAGMPIGVGKFGDIRREQTPVSLTTKNQDFNKRDANRSAQGLNFDNISSPIVLVIKKNSNTLKNVISWIESQYKGKISNHAMLMIDDESDYASINTSEEDDPTVINKKIRELISMFGKSAYVAFTATPYANIFINHRAVTDELGKDLFPDDFIYALDAPSNYFGARKIFLDTNRKHLVEIADHEEHLPLNHKISHKLTGLPESLLDAIRLFVLNIGIRRLRSQGNKHNSMLIHVTRFTDMHKQVSFLVENYFNAIRMDIVSFGKLKQYHINNKNINKIKVTFDKFYSKLEFSWNQVMESVCEIIGTVLIREVHSKTKIELEYRKDVATNAIVIGGTSLSRGFTLEGLSVSYFLRSTIFYDTLMQMGRWFGYRLGYEDLCHIYMPNSEPNGSTNDLINRFEIIIQSTEDLFEDFRNMAKEKMTPKDFGLAVKHHPDSGLQITAGNKMKNSEDFYFDMKLDGQLKEASWILKGKIDNDYNLSIVKSLAIKMENSYGHKKIGNSYLWVDVDKSFVNEFLNEFKLYTTQDPFGIRSRMPIDFIRKYVDEIETDWDVALYSGVASEVERVSEKVVINLASRKVDDKGLYYEVKNRQVSTGTSESIALDEKVRDEFKNNRKGTRAKLKKPLLMLHILSADVNQSNENHRLITFGISFPGGIKSAHRTVKLKINSVYIQNLREEEEVPSDD